MPTTLHINEIAPAGVPGVLDNAGDQDPWIELYNAGASSINLSGMYLGDTPGAPLEWPIPNGTQLCGGCHLVIWTDGEPAEGPLHSTVTPAGTVLLSMPTGELIESVTIPTVPAGRTYGSAPSGSAYREVLAAATPGAPNPAPQPKLILNEYNGVSDTKTLANGGVDPFFGPVAGNGGDWFETVVVTDHLDLRGWQFVASDSTGLAAQNVVTLTVADNPALADLRAGTILTVSENVPEDLSYDPAGGDWTINLRAGSSGTGASISALAVRRVERQLPARRSGTPSGRVAFGPAGEGVDPASGVGSDEVLKLEQDPAVTVTPAAEYHDGTSSTFGAPNLWSAGHDPTGFLRAAQRGIRTLRPDRAAGHGRDGNVGRPDVERVHRQRRGDRVPDPAQRRVRRARRRRQR